MTRVVDAMRVEAQNILRPDVLDPTRLIDQGFAGGMDHHHFMVKPRVLNQVMQGIARGLTGIGDLPDAKVEIAEGHRHRELEVLIIGSGAAGRSASERLQEVDIEHLVIDRADRQSLATLASWPEATPPPPACVLERAGAFAAYPLEGWVVASADETPALRTYRARHILLACGAREPMLMIPNNDRPGVVSALGLLHLLQDNRMELAAEEIVVVGEGEHARAMADQLRARLVAPEEVVDILAGERVKGLRTKTQRLACSFVALAPTPAPAHELAAMLQQPLRFNGEGFAVDRDAQGYCGTFGESEVWAGGDVCGYMGAKAAYSDGRRVASEIIRRIQLKDRTQHG